MGVIAQVDGDPIGAAWLRAHVGEEFASGYLGDPVAQLAIAVVPARRGRGWGRQLLERLLEEADKSGLPEIQLTVGLTNAAAVDWDIDHAGRRIREEQEHRRTAPSGTTPSPRSWT